MAEIMENAEQNIEQNTEQNIESITEKNKTENIESITEKKQTENIEPDTGKTTPNSPDTTDNASDAPTSDNILVYPVPENNDIKNQDVSTTAATDSTESESTASTGSDISTPATAQNADSVVSDNSNNTVSDVAQNTDSSVSSEQSNIDLTVTQNSATSATAANTANPVTTSNVNTTTTNTTTTNTNTATATDTSKSTNSSQTTTNTTNNNTSNSSTSNSSYRDAEDLDDEEYYGQSSANNTRNDHPFRDFFSNFRSKRKMELNRDEMILSRISDDNLMEYLRLEQKRLEILQQAKDVREKRIWIAFQITIALLSVVLIVYFLKDNPVILVTILYTIGILVALRIAKRPADSGNKKNTSEGSSKKLWE